MPMTAHEIIGHTKRHIRKLLEELTVRPAMYTGTSDLHVAELVLVNHIHIMAMLKGCTVDVRAWYNLRYPEIPAPIRDISRKMIFEHPGYQCSGSKEAKELWGKESSALIRWSMENMEKFDEV